MFKRRELKKAGQGDFVAIKNSVAQEVANGAAYKSSSFHKYGSRDREWKDYMAGNAFAKSHYPYNKISAIDAAVMIYKGPSIYSDDIVEVVPVLFYGENYDSAGMYAYISQGPFYVSKDDLDIVGSAAMKAKIKATGWRRAQKSLEALQGAGLMDPGPIKTNVQNMITEVRNES